MPGHDEGGKLKAIGELPHVHDSDAVVFVDYFDSVVDHAIRIVRIIEQQHVITGAKILAVVVRIGDAFCPRFAGKAVEFVIHHVADRLSVLDGIKALPEAAADIK